MQEKKTGNVQSIHMTGDVILLTTSTKPLRTYVLVRDGDNLKLFKE